MPKKKPARKRPAAKKKASAKEEYECEVCGTTFVASAKGVECMEDVICCGKPMKRVRSTRSKSGAKKTAKRKR